MKLFVWGNITNNINHESLFFFIICRENELSSNRGNNLVVKLLAYRYPHIFEETQIDLVSRYLSRPQTRQGLWINSSKCINEFYSFTTNIIFITVNNY